MAGKKKNTEVVSLQKYKRKGHLNIGTFLFGIIFVFLVFTVLIYFTKDRVSVYELQNTASFSGILENIRSTATVFGICSRNVITLSKYSSFEHTVILPFSYQSHNRVFLAI